MSRTQSQLIDTHLIFGENYSVYGYYEADTPENEFDYFDVFNDKTGECLTEGNMFFEKPTRQDVVEVVKDYLGCDCRTCSAPCLSGEPIAI